MQLRLHPKRIDAFPRDSQAYGERLHPLVHQPVGPNGLGSSAIDCAKARIQAPAGRFLL